MAARDRLHVTGTMITVLNSIASLFTELGKRTVLTVRVAVKNAPCGNRRGVLAVVQTWEMNVTGYRWQ